MPISPEDTFVEGQELIITADNHTGNHNSHDLPLGTRVTYERISGRSGAPHPVRVRLPSEYNGRSESLAYDELDYPPALHGEHGGFRVGDRVLVIGNDTRHRHFANIGQAYTLTGVNVGVTSSPTIHRIQGLMRANSSWYARGDTAQNTILESDIILLHSSGVEPKISKYQTVKRGKVNEMAFFAKRELPKLNYREV